MDPRQRPGILAARSPARLGSPRPGRRWRVTSTVIPPWHHVHGVGRSYGRVLAGTRRGSTLDHHQVDFELRVDSVKGLKVRLEPGYKLHTRARTNRHDHKKTHEHKNTHTHPNTHTRTHTHAHAHALTNNALTFAEKPSCSVRSVCLSVCLFVCLLRARLSGCARARSRRRCGSGEPGPGADVACGEPRPE
jgi:hypothetical protein